MRRTYAASSLGRGEVTKHLAVLEDAGLVWSERRGRQRVHFLNAAPIDDIAERWIGPFRAQASALGALRHDLEVPVPDTSFTYVTYIRTTPDRLWDALTAPEFTERYWGAVLHTDWRVGSSILWEELGQEPKDMGQVVLVADRPRVLSYSWHPAQPEHRAHHGWTDEQMAALADEPVSQVTFTIDDAGPGTVRLTVLHDGFAPGSLMLEAVSGGWPGLVASLKSLLETGEPLPV